LQNGKIFLFFKKTKNCSKKKKKIQSYEDEWPLVIICPSSLRFTWAKEIEKWLEIPQFLIDIIMTTKQKLSPRFNFFSFLVHFIYY